MLVGEVHLHVGAGLEDPGPELLRGRATPRFAAEHGVDLVGAADADVVGDERFEEPPGPAGVVQHEGA